MAIKTNERPGTKAVLRYCRMSGYKVREVLDLVRGVEYTRAVELLDHTDRVAAEVVAKLLRSAAANAEHNEGLDPEELFVVACFADEGTTLKRWRPRARGRATRIRKRTCHITVILARMPDEKVARKRARVAAEAADRRARRVAGTRRRSRGSEEAASEAAAPVTASSSAASVDEAATDWVPTDELVTVETIGAETAGAGTEVPGTTDVEAAVDDGAEPIAEASTTGQEAASGATEHGAAESGPEAGGADGATEEER